MDPTHHACVSARPSRVVHRTNQSAICGALVSSQVKPAVKRAPFAEKPFYFHRFNSQSSLIQNNCFSVPFSSNLAPVFLSNSARNLRTRYNMVLFKFKFVLFTRMPLEPYFMHNFCVLSLIRVILSLMCL